MRRRVPVIGLIASIAVSVATASAVPPVTGTLSTAGYTVIAISTTNGRTSTAIHTGKRFTVASPGPRMTLQLVSPKGSYAGTVVVGRKGAKVIVGIRAGARLGTVRVYRGYAKPVKPLAAKYMDRSRTALANTAGVPVGVLAYGLVKRTATEMSREAQTSPPPGGANTPNTAQAGADPDQDGVPSGMDIDANGNGVIDANDPAAPRPAGFQTFTNLFVNLAETVNAAAEPGSTSRIDSLMVQRQELVFLNVPSGATLDCNGLTWCSPGGTGRIQPASAGNQPQPGGTTTPFPACCLQGGYGLISGTSQSAGDGTEFRIFPRAGSTGLRSGDTMVMRVPQGSGVREVAGAIGFVFNTVPALRSWSAGTRSAAITYPVAPGGVGASMNNPFLLDRTSLNLTFTLWRPQRSAITAAGEPAGYMDIGHLRYQIQLPNAPGSSLSTGATGPVQCPQSTLSSTDANLVAGSGSDVGEVRDQTDDQPASPANTLAFTLDLGACITAKGGNTGPGTPAFVLHLEAMTPSGSDHANQDLYFRLS